MKANSLLNLSLIFLTTGGIGKSCLLDNGNLLKERHDVSSRNEGPISGTRKIDEKERSTKRGSPIETDCPVCSCGLTMNSEGGEEDGRVDFHVFPWLTILTKNGKYACFGSLISNYYVVTAASCIWNKHSTGPPLKNIEIVFVIHYGEKKQHLQSRRISHIKTHPNFMTNSLDSDIALLKLQEPVKFQLGIMPICLPEKEMDFTEIPATVVGLGTITSNRSSFLMQSHQPIIANTYCTNPYYGYYTKTSQKITKNMMCTAPWDPRFCLTATGGPLMVEISPEVRQIVGIVSWGDFCGKSKKPIVYTKITEFVNWILENTSDACYCA